MNSISPIYVVVAFLAFSFTLGISIIYCFKLIEIKFLTIYEDGTYEPNSIFFIYLDQSNPALVYVTLFFIIFSNKLFLIILIVVNVLLYVELRKIMKKKAQIRKE